ncbi:macrolide ABC transporter permease [Listeria newyorkensis]|uniref:Macrolide ABC transporter permease n=1 Tax=Listeria newyorkensis TaxID=1497681 RepID=A0ABX4XIP9_9LIST|nr:ABC transporter permease [Listeria newyorkensis]KGL43106.1 macrolide ABC transporter permease [Listeria newyorkensis]PNP88331.1 macrolide ABC transporter permease [Listeria newyorkensis]WAO21011.1 ABC transporter permease [Listeria newyorkensis]SQC56036.1 lipoprotein releasing system, transmembrane protein, LolC/E family [Listeria newyorkensis]
MNFIKRGLLSMKARKGRTILQLFIFTIVCVLILSGFTIQSAANKASELARQELGGDVTLSVDREKQVEAQQKESSSSSGGTTERRMFESTPVAVAAAKKLAELDHVAGYNLYSNTQAMASGFEPIASSNDTSQTDDSSTQQGPGGNDSNRPQMVQADLSVSGVLDSATATKFKAGTDKLVSGKAITASDVGKNVVMIEKTLAEENDLKVGDKIKIKSSDEATTVELTIQGIYETTDSGTDAAANFSFLNPYNTIYVPYTVANTIKGSDAKDTVDSAIYFMDDAANISAFEKAAKKVTAVDWDTFKLDANDATYQQMIGPINNVAAFSKNVVYIVSIAGALILGLLVMMQIRERKYEMGVLLAIGEKRSKLVGQFLVEILIVAVLSFGIAAVSSHYVAQVVGNQLLTQQNATASESTSSTTNQRGPGGNGGGPGFGSSLTANTAEIKSLDIQVSLEDMLKMGGIGVGIAFISVLLPSILVLRMNPKTILTKQE